VSEERIRQIVRKYAPPLTESQIHEIADAIAKLQKTDEKKR
jgi:hypothetical protein